MRSLKELALCLFVLFLPLEQAQFYLFGIETELKPYRFFLILALLISFFEKKYFKPKIVFEFKVLFFIFFYGLIIGIIRILLNEGNYSYLENGAIHFVIGLIILYLISNLSSFKLCRRLGNYLILGILLSSIYGLYQFVSNPILNSRLQGFFNNPNHLAIIINMVTPFILFKIKNRTKTSMNLFLLIFFSLIVFLTGSRTGLIIQFLIIFIVLIGNRKNIFNLFGIAFISFLIFNYVLSPILDVNDSFLSRYEDANITNASGRFDIMVSALDLGFDTFFSGVGIGQYRHYHLSYIDSNAYQTVTEYELSTHNHFLDLLINYGIISFTLFMFILFSILKNIKNQKSQKIYQYLLLLVLVLSSLSQEMFQYPVFWLFLSTLIFFKYLNQKHYE